jgi:hypothetical protein
MRDIYDKHNYHTSQSVYYTCPVVFDDEITDPVAHRQMHLRLANEAMKKALLDNPGSHITIHPEEII